MKTLRLTLALAILLSCARYAHAQAPTPLAAFSPLPTTGRTGPQFGADVDTRVSNLRTYADQKSRDNISGVFNLLSYGASGSSTATTGTISAASSSLTLAGAIDFKNGQGIAITGAGATNTAALPTGLSAALPAWPGAYSALPYNAIGGHQYLIKPVNNNAGNNIYEVTAVNTYQGVTGGSEPNWAGSCSGAGTTCTDGAITWTQRTSTYVTSYSYKLAAFDSNFGISAATSAFTCTGPSALNEMSPCVLKWTAGANDIGVLVYRDTALVAVVPASDATFNDDGNPIIGYHPDFPTTPPGAAVAGRLVTSVSSGAGTTTLTLANAATTSISSRPVNHDDTAALRAWATALLASNGSRGFCPQGVYQTTSPITFSFSSVAISIHVTGATGLSNGPAGCHIIYNGDPTKAVVYTNQANSSDFDHMVYDSNYQARYAFQMDNSDGSHPSTGQVLERSVFTAVPNSAAAAAIEFGHPGMGAWEAAGTEVKDSLLVGNLGIPSMVNSGIHVEQANGNVKDFTFYNNILEGFHTAYWTGGDGGTVINGGEILDGTGPDIQDAGQDALSVTGLEDENDGTTCGSFVVQGSGGRELTLTSNSWEGCAASDDIVVALGYGGVLTGNRFYNSRMADNSSVAKITGAVDNATPGAGSVGSIISLGNTYMNVPGPYLPPIYDAQAGNQVVDLVGGFPFSSLGRAASVMSLGDRSWTTGTPYALQDVDALGGDRAITRLFVVGLAALPVLDSNSGHPLLENLQIQGTGSTAPTATCSGGSTGVSIAAGSTNNRGQITSSSSASTDCTITWSAVPAWSVAPFCVFDDANASTTPLGVSVGACGTSTCVIDFASATSKKFNWVCM